MRALTLALALLGLASCTPMSSDGYSKSGQYMRERDMILNGSGSNASAPLQSPQAVSGQPLSAMSPAQQQAAAANGDSDAQDIASQTAAALASSGQGQDLDGAPESTAQQDSVASTDTGASGKPLTEAVNQFGISEENDFDAVGEQRTIKQDKEFIAQNRANYQQIQPTALPQRTSADSRPNIVTYALQSTQSVGTPLYKRSGFNAVNRYEKNCAKYTSPDQAQIAFLSRGGPQKDPMGLDPDGDGFACTWDPAPFRKAAASGDAPADMSSGSN